MADHVSLFFGNMHGSLTRSMPGKSRLIGFTGMAVLGLLMANPAKADADPELKALVLKLQQRVDQLETELNNQKQKPAPAQVRRETATAAPSAARSAAASAAKVQTAQRAAEQAQKAAEQAQQAAQQAQQQAAQAKETAAAEVKAAYSVPPGKPGGSFRIPGADTVVRIYGFIKLNAMTDLTTQDQADSLSAQSIQLFGTAAQRQGGDTQISARRSRFAVETWTPVNDTFGELHSLMEIDFAGQNTNLNTQATASGFTPRLRRFFADFGKQTGGWGAVLIGQENSVFSDNSLIPIQWLNDATFVGVSNIRQAQARYTYGFGDGVTAAFGVESPYSDITSATGTSYPDSNGGGGVGWQVAPDLTARVLWRQGWGIVALRGLVRPQIDLNNEGASTASTRFNKSTTGFGIGATAVVNLIDKQLVLVASGNAGSGLGRYLDSSSNGFGAVSNVGLPGITAANTEIESVGVYGGMVGLQYFFTPTIRTNMAIGGARIELPSYASLFGGCFGSTISSGSCSSTNQSEWGGTVNIIWSPFRALDLGMEYQHFERALQSAFSTGTNTATTGGVANRIQFSGIARF